MPNETLSSACAGACAPSYFAAALEAIDADPEMTWMVGDDLEGDILGAQRNGMRTVLVRTGKFRPDDLDHSSRADNHHRHDDQAGRR